jgi:ribosomal protein S27E
MSSLLPALLQLVAAAAIGFLAIVAVIATLGFVRRAHCGKCGEPQPVFRKPQNERQALWGGYTCRQCGTELDSSGSPIPG